MSSEMVICKICGKEFMKTRQAYAYCSDECREEGQRRVRKKYIDSLKMPVHTKICDSCGKEFQTRDLGQRCCSRACSVILRSTKANLKKSGFTDVTAQIVTRLLVIDGMDLQKAAKTVGWDEAALEKAMLENRQLVDPWRAYFEKERELRARMRRRYHVRVLP